MELLRTKPFTVPRVLLARMAAEAYVRQFWWFIAPGPVFGFVVLLVSQDPFLKAIGALGVVWPLTIPFRAYVITAKLAANLRKPTTMTATDDGLYFEGEGGRFKILYPALRSASVRHEMVVLRTKRFAAIIVPGYAFEDGQTETFLEILCEHGVGSASLPLLGA